MLLATGAGGDGHREVLGIQVATRETKASWNTFFADPVARGLPTPGSWTRSRRTCPEPSGIQYTAYRFAGQKVMFTLDQHGIALAYPFEELIHRYAWPPEVTRCIGKAALRPDRPYSQFS